MVCFTWSRLYGHSPFVLDSLTSKVSYTETLTKFDMRRNFSELYSFITYCVSKHRSPVPGHLSKLFVSVISCTYRQLNLWNRRHNTEFIARVSCCKYSVPVVRVLVAGQLRPQRLPAHPLQNTKIVLSHLSTLYIILIYPCKIQFPFGRPWGYVLSSEFFQKRTAGFSLF